MFSRVQRLIDRHFLAGLYGGVVIMGRLYGDNKGVHEGFLNVY